MTRHPAMAPGRAAALATLMVLVLLVGMSASSAAVAQTTNSTVSPATTAPTTTTSTSLQATGSTASSNVTSPGAATALLQRIITNVDPNGNGKSTYTIFYTMPQQAQVGTVLTIPVKLYVDNLTGLMIFLQDYTVQISLTLTNQKVITAQAGVNSTQAADNLGAGQLHAGQEWGPVNITMPLTQTNTGLSPGLLAVGNATLQLSTDVWFNQPINFYRPEMNQTKIGYVLITNGAPVDQQVNYPGIGLLALGVVLVGVAFVMRQRKLSTSGQGKPPPKAPGSV